jgi:hypothetical protein
MTGAQESYLKLRLRIRRFRRKFGLIPDCLYRPFVALQLTARYILSSDVSIKGERTVLSQHQACNSSYPA